MSENTNVKTITIRLEDEEESSGYFEFPAVYAGNNKAVAVLNGGVEVHFVEPTGTDQNIFEFRVSTEPLFNIEGHSVEAVLHDLSTLTFPELLSKYTFKGFHGWKSRL